MKIFWPPHDKTNKMASAHSEGSDQPGHPSSLIRVFAVRMKKACMCMCVCIYIYIYIYMSHVMRKPVNVICEQQRHRSASSSVQPAHRRSLISAFVVRCLDSIVPILVISKISRLQLVSVAEQSGLSLTLSETPKTGFLVTWLIYLYIYAL